MEELRTLLHAAKTCLRCSVTEMYKGSPDFLHQMGCLFFFQKPHIFVSAMPPATLKKIRGELTVIATSLVLIGQYGWRYVRCATLF